MQARTVDSILDELRDEGHIPMMRLVEALRLQKWAGELNYDLSMLRLWIARKGVSKVEIMITYGDGRHGGRPLEPYVDAFETTHFVDSKPSEVSTQDTSTTIERLGLWLAATENG